jgi:signal transduction histidine kinase
MNAGLISEWVKTELWDQVPVRICVIDHEFKIVEVNRAFREAYGNWIGEPCYVKYKGRSERCQQCSAAETFADGRTRVRQSLGPVINGRATHDLVRTVPIELPDGSIPYIVEMTTDITQMTALNKESATIRNWVRNELWDQVPVRICVIDREYKIVEANRAFTMAYGDFGNHYCYSVYKDRSERCLSCNAAATFVDGEIRTREEKGLVIDGEQTTYLVRVVPVVMNDGEIPYIIEMSTDITEVKRLGKEKMEAERLAAVGQTVAGLAHGVKNVLMGVEGGMYVFRSGMEKGDSERIFQGWKMLEGNIERITFFVKEFLEFARGRVPTVQLVDPNRLAEKVFDLFHDTAGLAGVALHLDLQDSIPYALMDEEALHTCLSNLVTNAIDACKISDQAGRSITISTRDRAGVLVFKVADDGAGMDYDVKKKIFTAFFSTKGSDKGTGLGLLTTRKIVQEHGGRVSFDSKVGEGSVFSLEFPRENLPQPGEGQGSGETGNHTAIENTEFEND